MNNKAFTLVETLVSVAILSFVLLGIYGMLQTGNTVYTNDGALLEVQQHARNGMDRMVREIRQSSSRTITVINANSDKISIDIPGFTNIQYYISGTDLVREYPSGTIKKIAPHYAYLKFTLSASLLKISMRADKVMNNKTTSFTLVEVVRFRN